MDTDEHPALKNFSPTWESIKHVAGKALTYAAYGAAGLALLSAPISPFAGLIGAMIPSATATGTIMSVLLPVMKVGAMVGGVLGAVVGIGGIPKALEERKQDVIADGEQAMLARERQILLARGRGQSFSNSEVAVGNVAYRAPAKDRGNQGIAVG